MSEPTPKVEWPEWVPEPGEVKPASFETVHGWKSLPVAADDYSFSLGTTSKDDCGYCCDLFNDGTIRWHPGKVRPNWWKRFWMWVFFGSTWEKTKGE